MEVFKISSAVVVVCTLFSLTCQVHGRVTAEYETQSDFDGYQLISAYPANTEQRDYLDTFKVDYDVEFWSHARQLNKTDFLVPPEFVAEVKSNLEVEKIAYEVSIANLQEAIQQENPEQEQADEFENRNGTRRSKRHYSTQTYLSGHSMDWISYRRLSDIHGYLDYLATTFPDRCRVFSIGTSTEGRPLKVIHISNKTGSNKPAIWIDGGIHSREWISPAVVTYIVSQLVENSAKSELISNVDWYILPVSNPDGYEFTHTNNRIWRKTRSPTSLSRCRGADPNRNFGYHWNEAGTSRDPCSDIFAGSRPFSEPETQAISNFITSKVNQIKMYLTFHSYGQYWLIPWGYAVEYPSDYQDLLSLARKATRAMKTKYTVGNSADLLYPAAGGSDDWAKSIGIKYSYTIELPDTGRHGFILPASYIQPVSEDTFKAMEVLGQHVSAMR